MNLTKNQKLAVLAVVAALAVGYLSSQQSQPLNPAQRRPVLAAIFRAAKTLLWLAAFAEPPPREQYQPANHIHHVDDAGLVLVDHGQGW